MGEVAIDGEKSKKNNDQMVNFEANTVLSERFIIFCKKNLN